MQKTQTIKELWQVFQEKDSHITDTMMAGYGNKETDTRAYVNSGIPRDRCADTSWGNLLHATQANHVAYPYPDKGIFK